MRRAAPALAAALLAACVSGHRATDPAPSTLALAPLPEIVTAEILPEVVESGATTVKAATATETAVQAGTTTVKTVTTSPVSPTSTISAAARKSWGVISITTSIVSPSQLVGRELPYDSTYKKLPVFPERISLQVSWGMLDVGMATLSVDRLVLFNGRPAYHLVSEAKSNGFCDTFYRVRDLNESWLDARTLTSLGYSKKLREGTFYRDEWVLYDRDAGTFVARRVNKDGTFAVRTGTIPAQVQDILSSIYYVRAQELPDGGQVVVDVNTPDNWPLAIKVKERETLKTALGKFPAVLVEPEMRREGLFVQKGKRLRLWLSDDAQRRPLLMKVEVFFGHVTAAMHEML